MKGNQGVFQSIVVLFLALTIFLIVWAMLPQAQPTIEMNTSINPGDFKTSEQSVLRLSLTSNDQANAHSTEIRFVTYHLVHIYIGDTELRQETPDSGNYSFDLVMQPAEKTEQPFIVKVSALPTGIASQEFSIRIEAYADGRLITTQKVVFKVEQS